MRARGTGRAAANDPHATSSIPFQLEEQAARSAEFGSSLQSSRCEIADLNVRIQKLRSQILSVKSHVSVCRTHAGGSRETHGHMQDLTEGLRAGGLCASVVS